MKFDISPVLVVIGPFEIRWYSVCILVGVLIAFALIFSECKRFHINRDFMFNMLFWTIIFGIMGARIHYVLFNMDYYSQYPGEIIKIWNGGLAIHGGVIFGSAFVFYYCKKHKVNFLKILDICAPALIIAQACGRWGNFFNQEAYGNAVSYKVLASMKIVPQFVIDNMYIQGSYRLPMFYFESLCCILGFVIILIVRRLKKVKNGQVAGTYLLFYGDARFFIESFRSDSLMIGNFRVAQIISVIMILIGLFLLFRQVNTPELDELYNSNEDIRV